MRVPGRDRASGAKLWLTVIAAVGLSLAVPQSPAQAQRPPHLQFFGFVTWVDAEVEEEKRDTVREQYNVALEGAATDYLLYRFAYRYYRFNLDIVGALGTFRKEVQPSGEFIWKHPMFRLSLSAFHRDAEAQFVQGNFVTNNWLVNFRTSVDDRYPQLGVIYESQEFSDTVEGFVRDTRDQRFVAGLDYRTGFNDFGYNFDRRVNENRLNGLTSTQINHVFRWNGGGVLDDRGKLRLSGNYVGNYSRRTDDFRDGGILYQFIPPSRGLYLEDSSPDIGALEELEALIDGDRTTPTEPEIDIGGALDGRNIGLDLGLDAFVSALYLYTDRISGNSVAFSVYISEDNISWTRAPGPRFLSYNVAQQRYEILFDPLTTRYIKVVKGGLNQFAQVFVTEIEALEGQETIGEAKATRTVHRLDARTSYEFTPALSAALDISYNYAGGDNRLGGRELVSYALLGRAVQSPTISHQLRWEQSFEEFPGTIGDVQANAGSYTFLVDPLDTLSGSVSFSSRWGYQGGLKIAEVHNLFAEFNGAPTYRLNMSLGTGPARTFLYDGGRTIDNWRIRFAMDGAVSRSLNVNFSYLYLLTKISPLAVTRDRRVYIVGFDWRISGSLFARGLFNYASDFVDNTNQNYLLSWTLVPKFRVVGQAFFTATENGFGSKRLSVTATYELRRSIFGYYRVSDLDFSEAGGQRTLLFEIGLRATL